LALSTPEYKTEQSKLYYDELVDYTSPKYNFELRQNAFQYLLMSDSCKVKCQENLQQATTHHNWRLSKFAKEQLKLINTN
ncbi:MAG: M1 family peptidase, partial [Arcobacter sp.]|nr:M1 family peptidase [Arcobacter sp.]